MQDFNHRVAVITGAASGIGKALATAFLREGARVVCADVDETALHATCDQLSGDGYDLLAVQTDVSQPAHLERLAVQAYRQFGQVDILCNNAAVTHGGPATWENTLEDWERVLGVNLMGVVHGVNSFVPRMIKQGTVGAIVNTSSILGITLGATNAAYPVSKHGVVVLSECIYNEFRRQRIPISVHVMCPSFVATNILQSSREGAETFRNSPGVPLTKQAKDFYEWFDRQHRRGMLPAEAAQLVVDAIRDGTFYVLTHPQMNRLVEYRMRAILGETEPSDDEFTRQHAEEFGIEPPPPRPDEIID